MLFWWWRYQCECPSFAPCPAAPRHPQLCRWASSIWLFRTHDPRLPGRFDNWCREPHVLGPSWCDADTLQQGIQSYASRPQKLLQWIQSLHQRASLQHRWVKSSLTVVNWRRSRSLSSVLRPFGVLQSSDLSLHLSMARRSRQRRSKRRYLWPDMIAKCM